MSVQIVQATAQQTTQQRKVNMIQRALKEWAAQQREQRGWSIREMAERMNSPHSSIRRVFDENQRVGVEVSVRLAQIFNKPVDEVLEMGGFIPRRPEETKLHRELQHLFDQMPIDKRHDLIDYARFLLAK